MRMRNAMSTFQSKAIMMRLCWVEAGNAERLHLQHGKSAGALHILQFGRVPCTFIAVSPFLRSSFLQSRHLARKHELAKSGGSHAAAIAISGSKTQTQN